MNIKTERCTITELQSSDFQEAVNLFTNENVRMYLGGTISKAIYVWTYNLNIVRRT